MSLPRFRRRPLLAAPLVALLGAALPGCARPEPLLRVGTNVWPGYETLYLARELGLYDERRIRLIEMPAATDVLRALAGGTLEAAALTLDEMLTACAAGLDLVALLVFDVSHGADALLVRPDIRHLADLAGRRIAVEQTAVGALMLDAVLRAAGLQPAEVKPVYLTASHHVQAYELGQVDAVIGFEPSVSQLLQRGARRLYDSSRIPGTIVDVLAVPRAVLVSHAEALRRLLQGHFRVLPELQAPSPLTLQRVAARLQIEPDEVRQSLKALRLPDLAENRHWLGGDTPQLQHSARHLYDIMQAARMLAGPLALERLCDAGWLPAAGAAA
ncbi:MAG: hypothetical protein RJA44_2615 [Pseudomonadota bacterium]